MPAKIRTIKATSISALQTFNFNRSIEYQGESLGLIKLIEKKSGSIKAKVYQDLNNDHKMTKKDLIYKGTINDVDIPDDLTNFSGTVKLKKNRCTIATGKCRNTLARQLFALKTTFRHSPT